MLRNLLRLVAGFSFLLLGAQGALSFTLVPMRAVLTLPADIGGQTLQVRNPRRGALPLVFEIFEREVNEDGTEVTKPADDAFVVFPPQAVVPAGKTQAVRIQWVGGALTQSRSFVLFAREVPVNLSGHSKSGVKALLRVGASIHVTSRGFAPKPQLVRYRPAQNGVMVSIGNSGNEYIYINELGLQFGSEEIGGSELANVAGRTLIPPGVIRTFRVGGVHGAPKLIFANQ